MGVEGLGVGSEESDGWAQSRRVANYCSCIEGEGVTEAVAVSQTKFIGIRDQAGSREEGL